MKNVIGHKSPKFSFFMEKHKILISDYYNKYIDSLRKENDDNLDNNEFITNDILKVNYNLIEK